MQPLIVKAEDSYILGELKGEITFPISYKCFYSLGNIALSCDFDFNSYYAGDNAMITLEVDNS